jgi:protein-tyrosine phosphatase
VSGSARTHNYHPNSPPDSRSQIHAAKRGYDLSQIRARAIQKKDFEDFDLLITMDWDNRALLEERCPNQHQKKIKGLTEFLLTTQANVIPDPYYGGEEGFEYVLDLVEEASEGLLQIATKRISQ